MLGANPNLMITDYNLPKQILKIFLTINYSKLCKMKETWTYQQARQFKSICSRHVFRRCWAKSQWDKDYCIRLAVFHSPSRDSCDSTGLVRTESGWQQKAVEQNFVLIQIQVDKVGEAAILSSVHILYLNEGHNCFLPKPCQFIT